MGTPPRAIHRSPLTTIQHAPAFASLYTRSGGEWRKIYFGRLHDQPWKNAALPNAPWADELSHTFCGSSLAVLSVVCLMTQFRSIVRERASRALRGRSSHAASRSSFLCLRPLPACSAAPRFLNIVIGRPLLAICHRRLSNPRTRCDLAQKTRA